MPFMLESFHILFAKILKAVINKQADEGAPLPYSSYLCNLKYIPVLPLFRMVDSILLYIVLT